MGEAKLTKHFVAPEIAWLEDIALPVEMAHQVWQLKSEREVLLIVMSDKLNGFDMSRVDVPSLLKDIGNSMMVPNIRSPRNLELIPYSKLQLEEQKELKQLFEAYQEESLCVLRAIEQNTANLYTLVDLISKNNEQQDELIAIIAQVLTIAKAKSKTEAETTYTKVMGRITQTVKDAETLEKIVQYATIVWQLAQPIIEKLPQ